MKILINGAFLCSPVTGLERFARQITKGLDEISKEGEIGIVVPKNAKNVPVYKKIKVVFYEKDITSFSKWQQFILPRILKKHKALPLDFGNNCSLLCPGISFLYDIYCELYPEDFQTKKEKLVCLNSRLIYRIIAYRAKKIIAPTYFSRGQIAKAFRITPDRIAIVHNSWEHFNDIKSDSSIFSDFPVLAQKPFYFSLGSLSKRKNIKWIIEYAAKNPSALFAISGSALNSVKVDELSGGIPANVILLGYLDDGKVKALMEKCKAFVLPSYYEGFGFTPLEALSCGAKIIVARAASLPEVYGGAAHYIDPFDTDVDLDKLLEQEVEPPDEVLKKYSYDESVRLVYDLIQECIKKS
ncbi:MAG: glycosyltransferase family 4 protein [Spirochaetes bacterium]|nr:glycosyltransferase family 4 protein [Spirochaetota bacterium]